MVMQSKRGPKGYRWDIDSLKSARELNRRRVPKDQVKPLIDEIKNLLLRYRFDADIKECLSIAGLELNKILMK